MLLPGAHGELELKKGAGGSQRGPGGCGPVRTAPRRGGWEEGGSPPLPVCPADVLTGDAHWLNPRQSQRARKRMGWVKEATAFQGTCSWKGQRMNTAWWRHWRADDTLTARAPSPGVGLCCSRLLQPSPSPSTLPRLQCHPHADDPHIKLCLETHPCMFSYGLNGMSTTKLWSITTKPVLRLFSISDHGNLNFLVALSTTLTSFWLGLIVLCLSPQISNLLTHSSSSTFKTVEELSTTPHLNL